MNAWKKAESAAETAAAIRDAILKDVTGRRGWRQEWDMMDDDVQDEIREMWHSVIMGVLKPRDPATDPQPGDIEAVFAEVYGELCRAQAKFAPFNSAHEGYAVLKEEVDELWDAVKITQGKATRNERMRAEAIQVAAMAIRFIVDSTIKEQQ